MYTINQCCRICGNRDLYMFLDLGNQPPANSFTDVPMKQAEYPLKVYFCQNCGLVQLSDVVNPEILFKDYAYYTGQSSKTLPEHFKKLAEKIKHYSSLKKEDLVVDIGGNDGTFLKNFSDTCRTVNIDPASNIVKTSTSTFYCDFFGSNSAFRIRNAEGKAKVITASNVFAHVNNLYDFLAGVKLLLDDDGLFVIEVAHWLDQYKTMSFDQIYHEHLSYFLYQPLRVLLEKFNLYILSIESIPIHGGSLQIAIRNKSLTSYSEQYYSLYKQELMERLYNKKTYKQFSSNIQNLRVDLINLLLELKWDGKKIIGYGAPAKGNTLLNYCHIGTETIDYLIDTTPYKQEKFAPGSCIPVVSPDKFYQDKPDYALMLAWNYETEILNKEKDYIDSGGHFVIPVPEPRIFPEE